MPDLEHLVQSLAGHLKRLRTERGLTLDALAARSGVSRGMLIQIEQARTNPSVGTVVKIGDALGVSVSTLLEDGPEPPVRLVPAERAVRLWSTEAGSHQTLLAGVESPGPLELLSLVLAPGDSRTSDAHPDGTTELLHVTAGELTLQVAEERYTVPAGTSVIFRANVDHGYRNEGPEPVAMSMVVSVPPPR